MSITATLSLMEHLRGLPVVVLPNLIFAVAVVNWCRRSNRTWNVVRGVFVALAIVMSLAGAFLPRPSAFK